VGARRRRADDRRPLRRSLPEGNGMETYYCPHDLSKFGDMGRTARSSG
jgi:hypothetical protein